MEAVRCCGNGPEEPVTEPQKKKKKEFLTTIKYTKK